MNRLQETPALSKLCHFDIPALYAQTINDDRFLLYDEMKGTKRILIFATNDQLRIQFKAIYILIDDTFSCHPPFFDQVYTLHALSNINNVSE